MPKKTPSYLNRNGYDRAIFTLTDARAKNRRDYWPGPHGSPGEHRGTGRPGFTAKRSGTDIQSLENGLRRDQERHSESMSLKSLLYSVETGHVI